MKVSAVGFLFQNKIAGKGLKHGNNYTCIIHKINKNGDYNRNIITSPIIKTSVKDTVSPAIAKKDIMNSLSSITKKNSTDKFKGATIKDGIKETEIHSILFDKLFAVRTKNEAGKNHFAIMGKNKTKSLLSKNLYISA